VRPLCVIDVVGLTPAMLSSGDAPRLAGLASDGGFSAPLVPVLPAVTCSVQSSMLTGASPEGHGIVGNGWYLRDQAEVRLWRQSNHLVGAEKVWESGRKRDPGFTCAKLFWWYNMHSSADWSVTPRPVYLADGGKLPDAYSQPPELRETLQAALGTFPLFDFWGPKAGLPSSAWIAECAGRVIDAHRPTLSLVYLPHLDYDLQRHGPADERSRQAVRDIDGVAGDLADHARGQGYEVVVVSEYGITAVRDAVHINRVLREAGFLAVHAPRGLEDLDPGASRAFAVADHQVAHVYVRDPGDVPAVRSILEATPGIEQVLGAAEKPAAGLDHPRSGELFAIAEPDRWFTYYHWLDDALAPDYARTVDIHSKPGYDPMELYLDPSRPLIAGRVIWKLLLKKLGFRTTFDVIGLDASAVRGSHGRLPDRADDGPVYLSTTQIGAGGRVPATAVRDLILQNIFSG
jgi:predicted AlkP superfamily pyrophosphatase or phosphodiesterase